MDISPFEPGQKQMNFIHDGRGDIMLFDRLTQDVSASLYIRTCEVSDPYSAVLLLSEDAIIELSEYDYSDEPQLEEAVKSILLYAKSHPLPEYLFFLFN